MRASVRYQNAPATADQAGADGPTPRSTNRNNEIEIENGRLKTTITIMS